MTSTKNIRIDVETHVRLTKWKGVLMARDGRFYSLSEALDEALKLANAETEAS